MAYIVAKNGRLASVHSDMVAAGHRLPKATMLSAIQRCNDKIVENSRCIFSVFWCPDGEDNPIRRKNLVYQIEYSSQKHKRCLRLITALCDIDDLPNPGFCCYDHHETSTERPLPRYYLDYLYRHYKSDVPEDVADCTIPSKEWCRMSKQKQKSILDEELEGYMKERSR